MLAATAVIVDYTSKMCL